MHLGQRGDLQLIVRAEQLAVEIGGHAERRRCEVGDQHLHRRPVAAVGRLQLEAVPADRAALRHREAAAVGAVGVEGDVLLLNHDLVGRIDHLEGVGAGRWRDKTLIVLVAHEQLVFDGVAGAIHALGGKTPGADVAVQLLEGGIPIILAAASAGRDIECTGQRHQRLVVALEHAHGQVRSVTVIAVSEGQLWIELGAARQAGDAHGVGLRLALHHGRGLEAAEGLLDHLHARAGHRLAVVEARHPHQAGVMAEFDVYVIGRDLRIEPARLAVGAVEE